MIKTIITVDGEKVVSIEHTDIEVAGDDFDEDDNPIMIPLHEYIESQIMGNMMFDGVTSSKEVSVTYEEGE